MRDFIIVACLFEIFVLIVVIVGRLYQVYFDVISMKQGIIQMGIDIVLICISVCVIIILASNDDNDLGSIQ